MIFPSTNHPLKHPIGSFSKSNGEVAAREGRVHTCGLLFYRGFGPFEDGDSDGEFGGS